MVVVAGGDRVTIIISRRPGRGYNNIIYTLARWPSRLPFFRRVAHIIRMNALCERACTCVCVCVNEAENTRSKLTPRAAFVRYK